jgi:RNA polymerase sigma factor (sigma-70 family)
VVVHPESTEQLLTLIRGCAKEDRTSQKMLYQQFYGYGMSVCLRYSKSRDEALEILNDGFLKIFTKINKYDLERSFKGWVRRIMINTALDHYRKQIKHYEMVTRSQPEDWKEAAYDNVNGLHQLLYDDLIALVQHLSPAYRAVFNLHVIDGYTHEEIADMLEISVGTSKSNLSKARSNLQEIIKKNYKDEYAEGR